VRLAKARLLLHLPGDMSAKLARAIRGAFLIAAVPLLATFDTTR
jgi:hypothetical protein